MLLHSLRSTHARGPSVAYGGDWWHRARCTGPDRDSWTSENYMVRAHAAHQCLAHCPVLEQCRTDTAGQDWRTTAVAGVVYDNEGRVSADRGFPLCTECRPIGGQS